MNISGMNARLMGPALRDLVATRVYPRYSRLKAALLTGRGQIQHASRTGFEFRKQAATWSTERKREWMLERLRLAVRRAYLETAYYRLQYDRLGFDPFLDFGFNDFANLPVLEKTDIIEAGPAIISTTMPPSSLRKDSTGGSTGVPVQIWLGPEERGWRQSASQWVFNRLGLPEGSRTAYLWGHHLDPRGQNGLKDRAYHYFNNAEWFDCFRLEPRVLEQYHQRLDRFRPACIIAYATALGALASHALEQGHRPGYPTSFILTGAEKLFRQHRRWAEDAFGCPVFERYGARDVGLIGFQSRPSSDAFEIDWPNILVEPESDQPSSPILITKLHADAMPMIRYRVGDIGLFSGDSRTGHPTFLLNEVIGRELERIWLPDGSWVQGTVAPHLLKDFPVREYMLVQAEDYSVELQIVPRCGFGELHRREIIRTLSNNLRGLRVTAALVERIPRTQSNKLRSVVSHVTGAIRSSSV